MQRLVRSIWIILEFIVIVTSVSSQKEIRREDFYVSRLVTSDQGLPGRTASVMTEDQYGFIWIGGEEGLARFDGNEFKRFKRTEGPVPSLIDNRIRSLLADGPRLWIGTFSGLCVMDLTTEKFTHFTFHDTIYQKQLAHSGNIQINTLYKDPDGHIWIGTPNLGFARYRPNTNDFVFYRVDPKDIPAIHLHPARVQTVLDMCTDAHDPAIMWVGLYGGLLRFNRLTETYQFYYFPREDPERQMTFNAFRRIMAHPNGKIYSGSWHNVLQVFDPATERISDIPFVRLDNSFTPEIANVRSLTLARDHSIWITSTSGLLRLNPEDHAVEMVWANDELNNQIYGVDFVDWVGRKYCSSDEGLILFDPREQHFMPQSFAHLSQVGSGLAFHAFYDHHTGGYLISVGNTKALYLYQPETYRWKTIPIPSYLIPEEKAYYIRNIALLDDDRYVVATGRRLILYHPSTQTFSRPAIEIPLDIPRIHNAYVDSQKKVWVATASDGVWQWDMKSQSLRQFNLQEDPEFGAGNEDTFLEDHLGQIWIKCRRAYAVYDPVADSLMYYPRQDLITPFYTTFAHDPQGQVWVASSTGWVGRIDPAQGHDILEKVQLGDIDNALLTMQMDDEGYLWVALKEKLVRLDTKTRDVVAYPLSHEFRSRPFFSMHYMPDGHLVFTSRDHILLFDTHSDAHTGHPSLPYITGIDIREQPLVTDTCVHHLRALRFSPQENFFSLSFSALGLTLDHHQQFRYRLRGFQNEWIEAGERRHANFTNVPSGTYTFELELYDQLGQQEMVPLHLPIVIAKRITERIWFRMTAVLLLLGFIHSVYRYRIQQIRKEEKLKTGFERQLALAETQALRAQMNPHFIFNSLNSIENYILRNDTEKAVLYLGDFSKLIRLILENSRSVRIPLRTELETLGLYLEMESLRFKDKLQSTIRVDPEVDPDAVMIPPMLIQPFVENAIWHGIMPRDGTGKVTIDISSLPSGLRILIEDNGIGRARSAEINSRKIKGTKASLGMTITQERMDLYNRLYEKNMSLTITDLMDSGGQPAGTRVEFLIPA